MISLLRRRKRSDEGVVATLVVPCFQGARWITTCLESIVDQDLDRRVFEVIVVVNGEPDESPQIVDRIFARDPELSYRVVFEERASLSHARNVGIALARGSWVTWVDVDDWLSPNYLSELIAARREGTVPLARVVNVDEVSAAQTTPVMTEEILACPAGAVDPAELWRPLTFAACKLLPTHLARQSTFDVGLKSGEDVAYFAPFMAHHNLTLHTAPAHAGATYYRMVRSGSLGRQAPSYQFSVTERIAVMKHLDDAAVTSPSRLAHRMRSMMNSQAQFIGRYLEAHPADAAQVRADLADAGLRHTPWKRAGLQPPSA